MDRLEVINLVAELCTKANVPGINTSFECSGNTAGTFTYGKTHVYVDFNEKFFDEKDYYVTVIHEVAHYVRYVRNDNKIDMLGKRRDIHGTKWKAVMVEISTAIGLPIEKPTPYHTYSNVTRRKQKRWGYKCNCLVHKIATVTHNKMLKGQKRHCKLCNYTLIFTGKEV